jgi:hypothetical protein
MSLTRCAIDPVSQLTSGVWDLAREASKRIVQDILRTAGGGDDVADEVEGMPSPSIVVGQDLRREFQDSF